MLKKRIIVCLDVKDGRTTKGVRFKDNADIGDPVVTFVGTLKPWHGVTDLLAAAALAKRPWKLRIIGDGPERATLEEQAAGLGIEVDFRGAVAPPLCFQAQT